MNTIRKLGLTAAVLTAALGISSFAYATTIDFGTLAIGNEGAYTGPHSNGEVTWTATASGNGLSTPYLDGLLSGREGGLGVCSLANCAGSTDDNVGYAGDFASNALETLFLSFDTEVTITELAFQNRDHFALASKELQINGDSLTTNASGIISGLSITLAAGELLSLTHLAILGDIAATKARDFYLNALTYEVGGGSSTTPVPIPGALPLLASGVVGLGYLARKRRKPTKS